MSDFKKKLEQTDGKPFFSFSGPYLDFIDKSKIFTFVYYVMAIVNLILPFAILYKVIDSGFFKYVGAKYVFAFVLSWIVIVFASWIGFQLWWNRRKKIVNLETSDFGTTLIFCEIIRTSGEWLGTLIGIIGAGAGLLASIFLGNDVNDLFRMIGMGYLSFGPLIIIVGPIIGFSLIILFRFIAEQLRIFATIADSTRKMAGK